MSLRDDLIRLLPAILEGTTPENRMSGRDIARDFRRRSGTDAVDDTTLSTLPGLCRESGLPIAKTQGKHGYYLRPAIEPEQAGWAEEHLRQIVEAWDAQPLWAVHNEIEAARAALAKH